MANDITLTQPDLIDRLLDNLPSGYTAATVKVPGAPFKTPTNTKWMRATVLFGPTVNVTPDGYKRTFGIYVVDIFFPKNSGDKSQLADTKEIQTLFDNKQFGNTRTWSASAETGVVEDDPWLNMQVSTEFFFEGV